MDELIAAGLAEAPWEGQVQRVREWYEPHLERIYDAAQVRAGDLLQLERIAASSPTRETFLTEMALDPPQATGDLSGEPYLDEDYLDPLHRAFGEGAGVGRGATSSTWPTATSRPSSPPAAPS